MRAKKRDGGHSLHLAVMLWAFCMAILLILYCGDLTTCEDAPPEPAPPPQEQMTGKLENADGATLTGVSGELVSVAEQMTALQPVERYAAVTMTDEDIRELAALVYLEARGESAEGQQAVVEVVLNRVISLDFPDTVREVVHQGEGTRQQQFSTVEYISQVEPGQAQYDAIDAAIYGPSILPDDVVFFSTKGENDRVWGTIGGHVFCYGYER